MLCNPFKCGILRSLQPDQSFRGAESTCTGAFAVLGLRRMPKRQNPFGDPYAAQFKMHISQKEVDLGVNKEHNMKVVYEKTLALLYGGQKKGQTLENGHDINGQLDGHDMNGQLNQHDMNGHHTVNGKENGHDMNGHNHSGMNGHHNSTTPTDALQQLMNGGQKMSNGHPPDVSEDMDVEMTDRPELVSGQSFLDANCKLVHSVPNGATQAKGIAGCPNNNNNTAPPPACQMCKRGRMPKSHCSFCDKLLCAGCIRQCDNCEDKFCALCSTVNQEIQPCWTSPSPKKPVKRSTTSGSFAFAFSSVDL